MMANYILAKAVHRLKESGHLEKWIAVYPDANLRLLAEFAVMVLEQPAAASVSGDGFDLTWHNQTPEPRGTKLFTTPPAPAPDDIELRAERAAKAVVNFLYKDLDSPTINLMAINVKATIVASLLGEE